MKKTIQKIEVGQQIGHWRVVGELQRIGTDYRYSCQCACGNERMVSAITLRNGTSTSCGCRKRSMDMRKDSESRPISPNTQEALNLINRGYLPPADQFSVRSGCPAWTLESIAAILGVTEEELKQHIEGAGQRFLSSNSWEAPASFNVAA